jgi:hypothetical protein
MKIDDYDKNDSESRVIRKNNHEIGEFMKLLRVRHEEAGK